jgi:hypothetical protein
LLSEHPALNHVMPPECRFIRHFSAFGFRLGLRHGYAGSPQHSAETGSLSYGLPVHLRLLPTPPCGDAVIFDYGAATSSCADLHRADKASSRQGNRISDLSDDGAQKVIVPGGFVEFSAF